eukprot:gnl/MRDRNA2_/MRDRNA2_93623_c0_seq1.p1 gnl/MRDRNA2_/MRDRNA2_93623_c0~~gnl/MRDRNA2_/MRDRNA2_93623_c0_seq1.p1  ORF type:complete len:598 (+),score=145.41 gnl/MRDRNA2_/MRDRNA2_93623_c0_seq1:49-1842(+)
MQPTESVEPNGDFLRLPPELVNVGGGGYKVPPYQNQSQAGGLDFRVALELREELRRLENQHALLLSFLQEGLPAQLAAQLRSIRERCEANVQDSQAAVERQIQEEHVAVQSLTSKLDETFTMLTERCVAKSEHTAGMAAIRDAVQAAESRAVQKSAELLKTSLQEVVERWQCRITELGEELHNKFEAKLRAGIADVDSRISFELQTWDSRLTAVEEDAADVCSSCTTMQSDIKRLDAQCSDWHNDAITSSAKSTAEEEAQRKQAVRTLARSLADEACSREEGDVIVSKALHDARRELEGRLDEIEKRIKVDYSAVGDLERWRQDETAEVARLSKELIAVGGSASSGLSAAEERAARALDNALAALDEKGGSQDATMKSLEARLQEVAENVVVSGIAIRKDLSELAAKAECDLATLGHQCRKHAFESAEACENELRKELLPELTALRVGLAGTETECAQLRLLSDGPINFVWCIDAFEETSTALGVHSSKYIESPAFRLRASEGLRLRLHPHGRLQSRPGVAALAVYQKRKFGNPFEASAQPVLRVLLRAGGVEAGPFELLAWDDDFDLAGTENFAPFDVLLKAAGSGSLHIEVAVPI